MMIKMRAGMVKPTLAMLTGKIKVKGMGKMGTFGKLFHPPKPDQELPFNPTPPDRKSDHRSFNQFIDKYL